MSLESALPVIVDGDFFKYAGKKVRIAARYILSDSKDTDRQDATRLLGYDYSSGIALLVNKNYGILVDPSLCMDPFEKDHWTRQLKMPVVVLGNLDWTDVCPRNVSSIF
jgi:hypothetical protein